jgi:hypothetical protein
MLTPVRFAAQPLAVTTPFVGDPVTSATHTVVVSTPDWNTVVPSFVNVRPCPVTLVGSVSVVSVELAHTTARSSDPTAGVYAVAVAYDDAFDVLFTCERAKKASAI